MTISVLLMKIMGKFQNCALNPESFMLKPVVLPPMPLQPDRKHTTEFTISQWEVWGPGCTADADIKHKSNFFIKYKSSFQK